MISMENWATQALEKLKKEMSGVSGQKEKAMAEAVMEAIQTFCLQEPEFAQAVVQGKGFGDCMKAVAKGTGNAISDLDAYRKAVQFYFPGAEVHMQMTIDLIGNGVGAEEPENRAEADAQPASVAAGIPTNESQQSKILKLDLDDLFCF